VKEERNYHYQLEEMLRRDVSSRSEVVNVALEGYEIVGISVVRDWGTPRYRPRYFLLRAWGETAIMLFQKRQRRRLRELRDGFVEELGVYSASTFLQIQ
jgi:hypothetical protein